MNDLITKIEIISFRSIERIIIPVKEINVFSGVNDIGKSNILKALNLFFNNQTDFLKPLKFEDDYNMISRAKAQRSTKMKQLIKIRIYIKPPASYKILAKEKNIFVERQFDREGERIEKISINDGKKRASIKRLINKVKYVYIPALKGEDVLQYLLSLIGEQKLITDKDILSLNDSISDKTKDLKGILSESGIQIGTNFGLPTLLSDFWQKLSVNTSYEQFDKLNTEIKGSNSRSKLNPSQYSISLLNRGEGIKSKYIPPLLKWLDNNDKTKEFIWGIDEPENSLEFGLSDKLARLFFNNYAKSNQIFLTSHSLAFINPPENMLFRPKVFKVIKDEFGGTEWQDLDDLFRKQTKFELYDELGILLAQKEFIEEYRVVVNEKEQLKINIDKYTVPILIVEGKTDKWILEKAWNALNPNQDMPFVIYPSGLYLNADESEGNADQTRRSIEFISPMTDDKKTIIGLFDNDREGNEQYKSLSKKIFENYTIRIPKRKHKTKNIFGLLLPVPDNRTIFVGDKLLQRFMEIEHYFDDSILVKYKLKGDKVAPDSNIFSINEKHKTSFAKTAISRLDNHDFNNFHLLFDKISDLIKNE
ncbi:AAA family ATPase [candidate division KSB1 bacterium]|nr:AAA family ATPase [candidate division KSB1 bacterium]